MGFEEIISRIRLLALDVDGVLTDGSITWNSEGEEIKSFHVRDGLGIKAWQKLGFGVAVLTGRMSEVVDIRCKELGIDLVEQGSDDKLIGLDSIAVRSGLQAAEIAYIGDDWVDLPVFRRVGYAMTVPEAPEIVRAASHYVTRTPGGRGAVREAIEHLLIKKGMMGRALKLYGVE